MTSSRPLPLDPIAEARRLWEEHGWVHAAPGMAAITSLMRAQQIALAQVDEVLRPRGLTFARYEVLMLLLFSRRGAVSMARMGDRLQVHPTSVTNAVDRLQAAGLVERRAHPEDRRSTLVSLTEQGRSEALAATEQLNADVFARPGLPSRKVEGLVQALTAYRRSAGDLGG